MWGHQLVVIGFIGFGVGTAAVMHVKFLLKHCSGDDLCLYRVSTPLLFTCKLKPTEHTTRYCDEMKYEPDRGSIGSKCIAGGCPRWSAHKDTLITLTVPVCAAAIRRPNLSPVPVVVVALLSLCLCFPSKTANFRLQNLLVEIDQELSFGAAVVSFLAEVTTWKT